MAITALTGPALYPNVPIMGVNPAMSENNSNIALNGASRIKVGVLVQAPKTGTLDGVELYSGFISSPASITASFQDVTSAGLPDGTKDQYSALASPASGWNVWPSMTAAGGTGSSKRSVTVGDWLAVVLEWTSTQSGQFWIYGFSNNGNPHYASDLWVADTGAGFAAVSGAMFPSFALRYDDGTYGACGTVQTCWPLTGVASHTYNSGSTPDERGLKWTPPADVQVSGVWVYLQTLAACDLVIYDSGSTPVATASLDPDFVRNTVVALLFAAPVTLTAGAVYRCVVKPTSGTDVKIWSLTVNSAGVLGALAGGTAMPGTSRTDAGGWTDDTTRRYLLGFLVGGLQDGASVAGGGGSFAFVG